MCYIWGQVYNALDLRNGTYVLAPERLVPVLRRMGTVVSTGAAWQRQHSIMANGLRGSGFAI